MLVMFSIEDCFSLNMMQGSSLSIMPCPNKQVQLNFPIDGITHICWTIKLWYLTFQHKLHNYVILTELSLNSSRLWIAIGLSLAISHHLQQQPTTKFCQTLLEKKASSAHNTTCTKICAKTKLHLQWHTKMKTLPTSLASKTSHKQSVIVPCWKTRLTFCNHLHKYAKPCSVTYSENLY
jgi:hypothetical protein